METMYAPIEWLKPNPKNPRNITEQKLVKLMNSITENPDFFEARPIVVSRQDDGTLLILGGHQRYLASVKLGLDEVPVTILDNLSEDREDELMILDNHSSGTTDMNKLMEINPIILEKFDIRPIAPKQARPAPTGSKVVVIFSDEEVAELGAVPTAEELKLAYFMREEDE